MTYVGAGRVRLRGMVGREWEWDWRSMMVTCSAFCLLDFLRLVPLDALSTTPCAYSVFSTSITRTMATTLAICASCITMVTKLVW